MDFEALEAIRQLKYRYLRSLDLKQWDEFADTLCEDIVGKYGSPSGGLPAEFHGRDQIVEFMRNALNANIITVHVANHPEITVDGDTATGSWCMEDTVIAADYGLLIRGAAYYNDTYRREDGVWRIASTGYERIYESSQSTAELPGYTLLANRWADLAAGSKH
ncbi:nuclear transport factor 2 family protein [Nocardia sp. CDC160]|uniref:nuclear transport factor 2 family protein n=1 Tax=Nocardia sp. CDC160 TaxID=3112166 RepID=UPI002DBE143A|nr:nuclear transport factor 2 family protein [Nocardia sp. CDC160]MEC3914876.1 nuclear transport factor 2 family protein [Nocardia sp. CDC160]